MSLLTLENITKEYQNNTLLRGVSLRVEKGDRIALVGANGCGKSTLLKIAMGLESQDSGKVITARNIKVGYLAQGVNELKYDGEVRNETILNHEKLKKIEYRMREFEREMGLLQAAGDSIKLRQLLEEYSKLTARFEAMDGYSIESRIKKTVMGLGLREETLTIPVSRLSGGEKVRAAMAKILLEEPDLLILDEPTNHLDIQAMEWLEDFLKKFAGGVLFVSHDRYFLDAAATKIAELHNGSIIERKSNYSVFLDQKKQMRDFALKEQKRVNREIKNTRKLVQELRSKGKIKASMSREKTDGKRNELYKKQLGEIKQREHLFKSSGPKLAFKELKHISKDIAWAENLVKKFGGLTIFSSAGFHIRGGEKIGIIGPNGCGKTTLINLLLGKDKDYSGFIRLGEWVRYSYLGQEIYFEDENRTLMQEIWANQEMDENTAREYLSRFQFYGDDVFKNIGVLSGGERVRLYLAVIMLQQPDCLILDEPTNHLDVPSRDAVERALVDFKGTVISISHDRYYLTHCVSRILEISEGQIKSYEGNYEAYKQTKDSGIADCSVSVGKERKNKVQDSIDSRPVRKTSERKQIDIEKVETQIAELEKSLKLMEGCFDCSTPPEKYCEYETLVNQINELYKLWESLTG